MSGDSIATVRRAWAAELDTHQLYALLRLRVEVFVVEQACPYPELDGRDLEDRTRHLWLGAGAPGEPLLGCLRLLAEPDGSFCIGRVCTAASARGQGRGRRLMAAAVDELGAARCMLDAQAHLAGFYRDFGFAAAGPTFDWDGVPHLPMRR
jgi:ElaA protein